MAGVFWRHEPHLCLKAWLHGILLPVMSEEILAEYETVLERVKQEQDLDGNQAVAGYLANVGLVGYAGVV